MTQVQPNQSDIPQMFQTSISDIQNRFARKKFARPNRFALHIELPEPLSEYLRNRGIFTNTLSQDLMLGCTKATLPGRTLSTAELRDYGPIFRKPYDASYDPFIVGFRLTESMQEKRFFDYWSDYIFDTTTSEVQFYNNYTTTIHVFQLNDSDEVTYYQSLLEAYPTQIDDVDLDQDRRNDIEIMNVAFTYRKWYPDTTRTQEKTNSPTLLDSVLKRSINIDEQTLFVPN